MALKETNKNRKKVEVKAEKCPLKCWWWFPRGYGIYIAGLLVISLVALFL